MVISESKLIIEMKKNNKCQSLNLLTKEIGGVLKTVRTIRDLRANGEYHVSNLYRWRKRGFIPPIYWSLVMKLSNGKITLTQLLNEYDVAHSQ